eukprot:6070859-Amphidinium_carterae.1
MALRLWDRGSERENKSDKVWNRRILLKDALDQWCKSHVGYFMFVSSLRTTLRGAYGGLVPRRENKCLESLHFASCRANPTGRMTCGSAVWTIAASLVP